MMNRLPRIIFAKFCQKKILDCLAGEVREPEFTKCWNQMCLKYVPVMLLCCVLQGRKYNGFPVLLHEILQRAHRLRPLAPTVYATKSLRESMHCETARGEFGDRADRYRPPHPPYCSVCVNDILPPAGNPHFFAFATLKERTSLKPPANHRSSFDGSLGLFCVGSDCT